MANRIITVKNTGHRGWPGPKKSEVNRILADTYGGIVVHWHRNFRPKHFTEGAYREYHYAPRSRKYTRAKFKKFGHRNPLEWSGDSKQRSQSYRLSKSRNGAKVAMQVRTFNRRPKGFTGKMSAEFTRTSRREIAAYGVLARRILRRRMKGKNVRIEVTI